MADVIELTPKPLPQDNLLAAQPLEFRRGDWATGYAMLCTRNESARFEAHRVETYRGHGHMHIAFVPNHFTLDGGYHFTTMGLFRHRGDEGRMRRVYRLAGLMECVTNAPSPILRTDLLRRFYKSILEEREALNVVWRGNAQHFLLPMYPEHRNPNLFLHEVSRAESLKDLFDAIQVETDLQFDLLAKHYVFYLPESLLPPHANV